MIYTYKYSSTLKQGIHIKSEHINKSKTTDYGNIVH
jgi:hypothetical protein